MTADEFDAMRWRAGMKAVYEGSVYGVAGCNFHERLICLDDGIDDDHWVRCENVQLVGDRT